AGDWATYSFTTENLSCNAEFATDTPITISGSGTPTVTSRIVSGLTTNIDAVEVTLVIDHTFIGDLDGALTSPEGTTIQLFNPVGGGGCGEDNMVVTFSDAATNSHTDFTNTCTAGAVSVAGTYRPAQALSAFNGENPSGTWTLTIVDGANVDGGEIVGFRIDLCTSGIANDFAAQASVTALEVCNNATASFDLLLGEDFGSDASVVVAANGSTVNSVMTDFDEATDLLRLSINSWAGIPLGTSELTVEVADPSGASRTIAIPLTLSRANSTATLTSPANNAQTPDVDIDFTWQAVAGASAYRLEYALDEDFMDLLGSVELSGTNRLIQDLPGGKIFWRVVTLSACGEVVSNVNAFTVTTNSTQDFGQGRELSVYPNPVQRMLTVEAMGSWPGTIRAGLFDAAGRFLADYQMNGAGREQWDLGNLSAGVYYLRFSGAGQQRTERLVVLR
ncbi:MAG: proprotein convertase P-domain-containing protein, partial [Bacteroidota bacterium]